MSSITEVGDFPLQIGLIYSVLPRKKQAFVIQADATHDFHFHCMSRNCGHYMGAFLKKHARLSITMERNQCAALCRDHAIIPEMCNTRNGVIYISSDKRHLTYL